MLKVVGMLGLANSPTYRYCKLPNFVPGLGDSTVPVHQSVSILSSFSKVIELYIRTSYLLDCEFILFFLVDHCFVACKRVENVEELIMNRKE